MYLSLTSPELSPHSHHSEPLSPVKNGTTVMNRHRKRRDIRPSPVSLPCTDDDSPADVSGPPHTQTFCIPPLSSDQDTHPLKWVKTSTPKPSTNPIPAATKVSSCIYISDSSPESSPLVKECQRIQLLLQHSPLSQVNIGTTETKRDSKRQDVRPSPASPR